MSLRRFWQIVILSFYSPILYIEVVKSWKNWGLGVLIRFAIIVALSFSIILALLVGLTDFNSPAFSEVLKQIPDLKIEKNIAHSVDEQIKMPVNIKFASSNKNAVIVDLDITSAEKHQQNAVIFTKDRIAINMAESGTNVEITYADFQQDSKSDIINAASLVSFLKVNQERLLGMILVLGVPVGSLLYFAISLLRALFYAAFANVMAKFLNYDLNFKQLTRLAIITNIPSTIISNLLLLIFWGGDGLIQFFISVIGLLYLIWAMFICVSSSKL